MNEFSLRKGYLVREVDMTVDYFHSAFKTCIGIVSLKATLAFLHVDLTVFRPGDSGSESGRLLVNNKHVIKFKIFISSLTRPDFSVSPPNKEHAYLIKYIGIYQYIS